MDSAEFKALQAPLKEQYQSQPETAVASLYASGVVDFERLACVVDSPQAEGCTTVSGLHPKAGGDGLLACSGDMLLQSLVACSGVTFAAVATAMGVAIDAAKVRATGEMDFRGTLGVDRDTPVGITSISLEFEVDSDEPAEKIQSSFN